MGRDSFPKFRCPDCRKELGEFEIHHLPGEQIYDPIIGLHYNTGRNYCEECYSIRMGGSIELSPQEENELRSESERVECRFETKISRELIHVLIKGIWFLFDKESFEKFNKNFDTGNYDIDVNEKGYLVRINKKNERNRESFHRWLMIQSGELQQFAKRENLDTFDVHVHHKNGKEDNRLESLECKEMTRHFEEHAEESAWMIYRREHILIWYFKNRERFRETGITIPEKVFRKKFHEWWIRKK